jgi:hypothetical protein
MSQDGFHTRGAHDHAVGRAAGIGMLAGMANYASNPAAGAARLSIYGVRTQSMK